MTDLSAEQITARRKMFGRFAKIQLLRRICVRNAEQHNGLSCTQVQLLEYIHRHSGCPQMEVAKELGISPPAVAMTVKSLKQTEYLTAAVCPENQRCKQLYITPKGEEALATGRYAIDAFDAAFFAGFSSEEMQMLEDLTNRICVNMERALGREPTGIEPQDIQTLAQEVSAVQTQHQHK